MDPHPQQILEPSIFWNLGHKYSGHNVSNNENVGRRRFVAMFGVTHTICSEIWNAIQYNLPNGKSPAHLLWALLFLKNYSIEEINCAILKCDEKTFRKWVWIVIDIISRLRWV